MLAGVAYCAYYFISNLSYLQNRIYNVDSMTTADLLCAYWLLIIVMEAVRRFMGMNLFIFIYVFIAYAVLGQKISGIFKFRGMSAAELRRGYGHGSERYPWLAAVVFC